MSCSFHLLVLQVYIENVSFGMQSKALYAGRISADSWFFLLERWLPESEVLLVADGMKGCICLENWNIGVSRVMFSWDKNIGLTPRLLLNMSATI